MVGMNGVMIGVGYSIASYMGLAFFYSTSPTAQWRGPLGIAIFFPALMLIILCFLPESPRYLLMKGRSEEAWKIISKIHSSKADPSSEFARSEFYQMQKQTELDRTLESSWKDLVTKESYRKRVLVGVGFAFFSQSTGAFVINNYVLCPESSVAYPKLISLGHRNL
jgi:MFS family permease